MNLENSHYDAFISYRHSELDKFVAENLHKELEALKLPKKLIKEGKGNGKKRITRVFRDQEELPLTSDLAEPITNALRNTEYLIVICSPRLPESIWCRREVETFIAMHGREKVFAVLVEGRAHQSFPDAILWDEQTITEPDGTTRVEKIPVEPLAADVRGKNKREVKKKIKEEVLRLAAPMFDVSFDDLRQRHHERKVKRIMTAAIACSSIFLAFGAVSSAMAWHIHKQSQQITEQSVKLEEQYWDALTREADLTAEQATSNLQAGKRKEALQSLLEILPTTKDDTDRPYTAAGELALSQATWAYQNGRVYEPAAQISLNAVVDYMLVSPDGDRLLVLDKNSVITIWNLEDRTQLAMITSSNSLYGQDDRICFINNDEIAYYDNNKVNIFSIKAGADIQSFDTGYGTPYMFTTQDGDILALVTSDSLKVYQLDTGDVLYEVNTVEETQIENQLYFAEDDGVMLYAEVPVYNSDARNCTLVTVDMKTWDKISSTTLEGDTVADIKVIKDKAYVTSYIGHTDPFTDMPSTIAAVDPQKGQTLWQIQSQWGVLYDIYGNSQWAETELGVTTYDGMVFFRAEDGSVIDTFSAGEELVRVGTYDENENYFLVIGETGRLVGCAPGIMNYELTWIDFTASDISYFNIVNGRCIQAENRSMDITIYDVGQSPDLEEFNEYPQTVHGLIVNDDNTRMLLLTSGETTPDWYLYDLTTKELIKQGTCQNGGSVLSFLDDGSESFIDMYNNIAYYDVNTGEQQKTISLNDEKDESLRFGLSNMRAINHGKMVIGDDYYCIYVYDLENGKLLKKTEDIAELHKIQTDSYTVTSDAKYYAVISQEDQAINIYAMGDGRLEKSIPVKAGYVSEILFSPDDQSIFVCFQDSNVEVYNVETLQLTTTLHLENQLKGIQTLDHSTDMIVLASGEAYIVNDQYEIKARIDDYRGIEQGENPRVYVAFSKDVQSIPLYTYEELIKIGKEIISQ